MSKNIVESTSSKNANNIVGSSRNELVNEVTKQVAVEVGREVAFTLLDQVKKHLDTEREDKKKIRDTRIESLYSEIKNLMENIQKEEGKEEFDQERIDRWYDRLDKKELELKEMQDDADGFAKGLLKSINQFVTIKAKR